MRRRVVQWASLLLGNAYLPGFLRGGIYKGPLKSFCVPGLNCYSCPGALGACPLGALQAVLGAARFHFSFYVVGTLMAFGALLGRAVCGWLCPFGLMQELVHRISPFRRREPTPAARRWPRGVKYVLLLVFVVAIPLSGKRVGDPGFCKYICPAGTLTAGLPLLAANPPMRGAVGDLFALKLAVAAAVIAGCLRISRFFCRYLCPLGAVYGLFNKSSFYRLRLQRERCVRCGACAQICPMGIDPSRTPDSAECVRCGDCVRACRFAALAAGFRGPEAGSADGERHIPRANPPLSPE